MKKIVYLAPLALLGIGAKVSANQVPTRISNALMVYEQENKQSQPVGQNENEQANYQAKPTFPNGQNQPIIKTGQARQAMHISHLDIGAINDAKDGFNADRVNNQTMLVNKLSTTPTNQLQDSKISSTERFNQNMYISHLDTGSVGTESPSSKIKQTVAIGESQTMLINQSKITPVEQDLSVNKTATGKSVTIDNPKDNVINIHYVDELGHTIQELPESSIKLSDFSVGQSQGKFDVPDHRYSLADPNAQYTVDHTQKTIEHPAITHKEHHDGYDLWNCYITDEDKAQGIGVSREVPIGTAASDVLGTSFNDAEFVKTVQPYDETIVDKEAYTTKEDNYSFLDNSRNIFSIVGGNTVNVILKHNTKSIDPSHSGLSNDATNNTFIINNGAKSQINSQSRHFGAPGVLDLVTNKVSRQGDWQLFGKSNFDQTNINNDLVGYGNSIYNNLTFLAL